MEALKGISFELDHRQVTGLVGPDGAGKTTLLRIAAGLMTPTEGSVHVLGLDATRDSVAVQQRLSYMPQKFGLYQDLTVQENLDLYADLQGVDPAQRSARYDRLMQMTGLDRFRSRLAGKLSGGMKQKLGLACALVKSPEVLLLDEPTVGVDPVSRRELWQIVYDMVHTEGIGVLVATAYLDEAEQCGHVVMLHEGQILAASEPKAFAERLRGHVFSVSPAAGVRPRTIQGQLIGQPGIVDATIRNGRVRTVTADPDMTPIRAAAAPTALDGIHPTRQVLKTPSSRRWPIFNGPRLTRERRQRHLPRLPRKRRPT
ncbi:MAG: ABC transporter ATP-binding protein [Tepidisphaeraceae bacterium]